jgi:hypothetical protein
LVHSPSRYRAERDQQIHCNTPARGNQKIRKSGASCRTADYAATGPGTRNLQGDKSLKMSRAGVQKSPHCRASDSGLRTTNILIRNDPMFPRMTNGESHW